MNAPRSSPAFRSLSDDAKPVGQSVEPLHPPARRHRDFDGVVVSDKARARVNLPQQHDSFSALQMQKTIVVAVTRLRLNYL